MQSEIRWLLPGVLAILLIARPASAQQEAAAPIQQWRLGAEAARWSLGSAGSEDVLAARSVVLHWHPSRTIPFHLKGGVGYLSFRFDYGRDEPKALSIGPTLGFGYDVRLAAGLALSPQVSWITTPFGDPRVKSEIRHGKATTSLLRFGLGLSWLH